MPKRKSIVTLINKFKFSRRLGIVSAVMLIGVGALVVYLTLAAPGQSPLLVKNVVSASAPNQLTYTVTVTNITEQQIRNIRLNIQLPSFRAEWFRNLGTSTYVGSTDFDGNSIPVRPAGNPTTDMGSNSNCTDSYTDSGWYNGSDGGVQTGGCPHYAWKIATLSQGETRIFTYTVTPKNPGGAMPNEFRVTSIAQAYFTGTFTSRLSTANMPLNQNRTTSVPAYAFCHFETSVGWICEPRVPTTINADDWI